MVLATPFLVFLFSKTYEASAGPFRIYLLLLPLRSATYTPILLALGRLDALIFTGGIGENSAVVRRNICDSLDVIGVAIDTTKNIETVDRESDISSAGSKVRVWVVPTNEEMAIARDTYELAVGAKNGKE